MEPALLRILVAIAGHGCDWAGEQQETTALARAICDFDGACGDCSVALVQPHQAATRGHRNPGGILSADRDGYFGSVLTELGIQLDGAVGKHTRAGSTLC
jgi:hypothetical protein